MTDTKNTASGSTGAATTTQTGREGAGMSDEYRIVRDVYAGYEVQVRRWWWPFWTQVGINTHPTIDRAEAFAKASAQGEVKYLGRFTPSQTERNEE